MTGGIEYLFKKNKVTYIKGTALFLSPDTLKITALDQKDQLEIKSSSFLIATGSHDLPPPFNYNQSTPCPNIISPSQALQLP